MAAVCWLRVEPGYVKYSIGKLRFKDRFGTNGERS